MTVINKRNLGAIYKPSSKITTTTTKTYVAPTYRTTYTPSYSSYSYTPSTYVYIAPTYYTNNVIVTGGTYYPGYSNSAVVYTSSSRGGLIGGIISGVILILIMFVCIFICCCRNKKE